MGLPPQFVHDCGGLPRMRWDIAVQILDLLGDQATRDDVISAFPGRVAEVSEIIRTDDEVRRFRTPDWAWANMGGAT
jgi:hypothetical protein